MTHSLDTLLGWRGATAYDRHGEKLGKIGDLYLDGRDDVPAYAGIRIGLLGRHESIVPLAGAEERDGDVHVPYDAELVREAPSLDPDAALDEEQEHALGEHYGSRPGRTAAAERPARTGDEPAGAAPRPSGEGRTAASPTEAERPRSGTRRESERPEAASRTDDERPEAAPRREGERSEATRSGGGSPDAMVRSEEEVRVTAGELRPAEKVRLRKVMVTEQVEKTIPVRREVIQLEHEPAPEGRVESVEDLGEHGGRDTGVRERAPADPRATSRDDAADGVRGGEASLGDAQSTDPPEDPRDARARDRAD